MAHRKSMKILVPDEYRAFWETCPVFIPLSTFERHAKCISKTYGQTVQAVADRGGLNLIEAYLVLHDLPLTEYEHIDPEEAVEYLREVAELEWPVETARRNAARTADVALMPKCDFCGMAQIWTTYMVDGFVHDVIEGTEIKAEGLWDACQPCSELIDRDDWPGLVERGVAGMQERFKELADLPGLRDRLRLMFDQVRYHLHKVA